jgi:hypothetical protein
MYATNTNASAESIGKILAVKYTPAATIVAAWIKALTGVGPSIASGNHICNGNCADFPIAPQNKQIPEIVSIVSLSKGKLPKPICPNISSNINVPNEKKQIKIPISIPKSPTLFVINAFLFASAADFFSYQKPISR